jgi:UDP-glucose 4-epimerase
MRVLITGASGFAGEAVTAALADAGYRLRAAARDPAIIVASAAVEPVLLPNLAHEIDWAPLLQDIDAVIHLAGIAHAGKHIPEAQYDRINRGATQSLAQACAARGIRLVFTSSIHAQSAAADRVLTEQDPPTPAAAYGRAKLAAEDAIRRAGGDFTIFRPVLMYGRGVKGNMAALLRLADTPWPLPFAAFDNRRSLLAIDNFASAIVHALAQPATRCETYIVADDTPLTLHEIIGILRAALGRKRRLFAVQPLHFERALRMLRRGDLWNRIGATLVADTAKLRASGWRPPVDTRSGLAAMAQAASPRKSGTASRSTT